MRIDRYKLVTEMLRREMTVKALSVKSGVSKATLCSIRVGKSCSDETGRKIAQALGMSLDDLREVRR